MEFHKNRLGDEKYRKSSNELRTRGKKTNPQNKKINLRYQKDSIQKVLMSNSPEKNIYTHFHINHTHTQHSLRLVRNKSVFRSRLCARAS